MRSAGAADLSGGGELGRGFSGSRGAAGFGELQGGAHGGVFRGRRREVEFDDAFGCGFCLEPAGCFGPALWREEGGSGELGAGEELVFGFEPDGGVAVAGLAADLPDFVGALGDGVVGRGGDIHREEWPGRRSGRRPPGRRGAEERTEQAAGGSGAFADEAE